MIRIRIQEAQKHMDPMDSDPQHRLRQFGTWHEPGGVPADAAAAADAASATAGLKFINAVADSA